VFRDKSPHCHLEKGDELKAMCQGLSNT
jgi:hypothetical protein